MAELSALRPVGRAGATLAAASVLVHLLSTVGGGHGLMATLHVFMALLCVPCVLCLWCRPSVTGWQMLGLMGVGMVGIHAFLLGSPSVGTSVGGHHAVMVADGMTTGVALGMLCAVLETGLAAWVLTVSTMEHAAEELSA